MSNVSGPKQEDGPKQTSCDTKFIWTQKIEERLKELHVLQQGNWKSISELLNGPTPLECMYKWQQLNPNQGPSRQLWSPQEDEQLKELVKKFGKKWSKICTVMNWRSGKQVRERYLNQLQGTINQDKWTEEEDKLILKLYRKFGTKWSYMSGFLNGRPENMVKNRFYANLKKRYQCDVDDSDDDDIEEDSINSSENQKIPHKKKRQQPKTKQNDHTQKKFQVQKVNPQNFQIMTRSKINKQKDQNRQKQDGSQLYVNENNIDISLFKKQQVLQKDDLVLNNQINNIKEENILQFEQKSVNQSNFQQPYPIFLPNQDILMINNSNSQPQYQKSKNLIDYNQNHNLQQNKQSQLNVSQLPFVISQQPRIQMINPYYGFVSPQQQHFVYQLPYQSNYQDQINQLGKRNEFSQFYNYQQLLKGLQQ